MKHRMTGIWALAILLGSAPAFAGERHHRHAGRDVHVREVHRTVVHRPVYLASPVQLDRVYRARGYAYHVPSHRGYDHHDHCDHGDYWKFLGGAIVLGEILHHVHD